METSPHLSFSVPWLYSLLSSSEADGTLWFLTTLGCLWRNSMRLLWGNGWFTAVWAVCWLMALDLCLQVASESESTDLKSNVEVAWLRGWGTRGLCARVDLVYLCHHWCRSSKSYRASGSFPQSLWAVCRGFPHQLQYCTGERLCASALPGTNV